VAVFAALGGYAAAGWVGLVADPPTGRVVLAVTILVAAAAALAWIAGSRIARVVAWGLALTVALAAIVSAGIAIGMPARLLSPAHWGELGTELGGAFRTLGSLDYPYSGTDEWSRLTLLLGLPLWLGVAAALAFWPARRRVALLRTLALILIVTAYAIAITVSPPGAPLLHGLALLILVAIWLWLLPGLGRRDTRAGGALVLAAGVLALPAAAAFDGHRPWLDYRNWDWSWSGAQGGESFTWDHSYGPLEWQRTGLRLLAVKSGSPHYWRTVTLDRFDGYRWLESTASPTAAVELPRSRPGSRLGSRMVALDPRWIHQLTFTIAGLDSQMVVGAGTPLRVEGLKGVTPILGGLALAPEDPLGDGDTYTMRAYIPEPSAAQMRSAPHRYPDALAPYTLVVLPPTGGQNLGSPSQETTLPTQVRVPFRGRRDGGVAARALSGSPYERVYRLAERVTSNAATSFDAVQAIERYLRSNYKYSEAPPQRELPLRAFLLRDGIGYCQQFSGAMALMLRMVGIPARVASGFSAGTYGENNTYVVQDFDAHSWVEVYFNDIGWVPFDPTPGAAPARSQTSGLHVRAPKGPFAGRFQPALPGGVPLNGRRPARRGGEATGSSTLWLILFVPGLLALGAATAFGARALRNRSLRTEALIDAQLRELISALSQLRSRAGGGITLLALERRLRMVSGSASGGYAAKLRAARYEPGRHAPPSAADRRALRRELSAGVGIRGRLQGLLAIPPGGPAGIR
jgi:transglutaminase-like putative cysteine protease